MYWQVATETPQAIKEVSASFVEKPTTIASLDTRLRGFDLRCGLVRG
jgi:hypothetical protein